jgi:sporulation protein YlmC with PRC-barrel domain
LENINMRIVRTSAAVAAITLSLAATPEFAQSASQTTAAITGVDSKDIAGGYRASKVIGSTVVNDQNETVGKIDDVIIPSTGNNKDPVAVISVGGFLGVGSKLVAIPYKELRPDPSKNEFVLPGATKDSLKTLPEFRYT